MGYLLPNFPKPLRNFGKRWQGFGNLRQGKRKIKRGWVDGGRKNQGGVGGKGQKIREGWGGVDDDIIEKIKK